MKGEEGSGTINSLALIVVIIMCSAFIAAYGHALNARERLQNGADLAALAGASEAATAPWEDVEGRPCAAAQRSATVNEVSLSGCWVRGTHCFVQVEGRIALLGMSVPVSVRARAGSEE